MGGKQQRTECAAGVSRTYLEGTWLARLVFVSASLSGVRVWPLDMPPSVIYKVQRSAVVANSSQGECACLAGSGNS